MVRRKKLFETIHKTQKHLDEIQDKGVAHLDLLNTGVVCVIRGAIVMTEVESLTASYIAEPGWPPVKINRVRRTGNIQPGSTGLQIFLCWSSPHL